MPWYAPMTGMIFIIFYYDPRIMVSHLTSTSDSLVLVGNDPITSNIGTFQQICTLQQTET